MDTNLSLIVPLDRQMRDLIRNRVEEYFQNNPIVPPVSYLALAEYAGQLLKDNNWSSGYKAFVMVCCGNAIWRSVVGSVPYHRRMLLLPQCLKNSHLCQAQQDEMGLLCSDCGNCNISGFLKEAESLGYVTIVAEGTTIATRLVESGRIDAIIGVGCMEVLQKVFAAVNKYSLPSIGVPLLSCGCIDTTADAEWIKAEIRHLDQKSGFKLLNLSILSEMTSKLFTEEKIVRVLQLGDSATDKLVKEILLAGGKRIRPMLTLLTYESFCQHPDPTVQEHLALSIECFHKASLIHDDIEDNDSSRYGRETLHIKYNLPIAINTGDLLIGEGYSLIAASGLPAEIIKTCLQVVSQGHRTLSHGQGAELMVRKNAGIPCMKEIMEIFRNKTSAAFQVALLLGAVAGGADESTLQLLGEFSHRMGIAYQLKDDLEDFRTEDGAFENPSVLISLLAESLDDKNIDSLKQAVDQTDLVKLRQLIDQYKIKQRITELLKEQLVQLEEILGAIKNIRLKLVLHEIVGKTFRLYI